MAAIRLRSPSVTSSASTTSPARPIGCRSRDWPLRRRPWARMPRARLRCSPARAPAAIMQAMVEFSKTELSAALHDLGEIAVDAGKIIDLALYGGSCLILVSNFRLSSEDVDAV